MQRCFKLFKLALTAALLVGILLVTDINRLNVPEQIGKNHLFSILDWELSKLPDKWSYKIKSLLKNDEQTKSKRFVNIYSYFNDGKNNLYGISTEDVEASIENLISEAIKFEGLTYLRRIIFPPVLITLDSAPNILITSPREKILRGDEALLDPDLSLQQAIDMENKLFEQENLSSLVIPIGGIATYPVIVSKNDDILWNLQTASHEWLHTFMVFRPLGFNMFKSIEMQILNETVANIVGKEIGHTAFNLLYEDSSPELDLCELIKQPISETNNQFNFSNEMNKTRLNTEWLLSEGKVSEAELYMDNRRLLFNSNGYPIRKLNQAYFAFYGTYADSPGSISIIGPQVNEYRLYFDTLSGFVNHISKIGSYQEFERSLQHLSQKNLPSKRTHSNSTVVPFICQ
jgi:hypothetical protein|tara:strand:+ start:20990 stop:22195 length:1206 start_codon:yes stop_codon:yes gene_type:complete